MRSVFVNEPSIPITDEVGRRKIWLTEHLDAEPAGPGAAVTATPRPPNPARADHRY